MSKLTSPPFLIKAIIFFILITPHVGFSMMDDISIYDNIDTIITPSRSQMPITDSPISVTKLDMQQVYYLGLEDLEEVMRLVPGFRVGYTGLPAVASYHGTQAILPRRNKYLLDSNSTINSNQFRSNIGTIPITSMDLQSIEVLRGPSVNDYGSKAFLSTVNLISVHPEDKIGSTLNGTYGNLNTKNVAYQYGNEFDGNSVSMRIAHRYNEFVDEFSKTPTSPLAPLARYPLNNNDENTSILFQTAHHNSSPWSIKTNLLYSKKSVSVHIFDASPPGADNTDEHQDRAIFASADIQRIIKKDKSTHQFRIQVGHNQYKDIGQADFCVPNLYFYDESQPFIQEEGAQAPAFTRLTQILISGYLQGVSLNVDQFIEDLNSSRLDNLLNILPEERIDYERFASRVKDEGLVTSFVNSTCGIMDYSLREESSKFEIEHQLDLNQRFYSTSILAVRENKITSDFFVSGTAEQNIVYLSNHIRYLLNDQWTLNASAMFEHADNIDKETYSPRASITYKPKPNHAIRIGSTLAYRSPTLSESAANMTNRLSFVENTLDIEGNPPELVTFGFKTIGTLEAERMLETTISYYFKSYSFPITYNIKVFKERLSQLLINPPGSILGSFANDGNLTLMGSEFKLEYQTNPLILGLVYSYLDSETDVAQEESLYSRHAGSIYGIYHFPNQYHLSLAHYSNSVQSGVTFDRTDLTLTKQWKLANQKYWALQLQGSYLAQPVEDIDLGEGYFNVHNDHGRVMLRAKLDF